MRSFTCFGSLVLITACSITSTTVVAPQAQGDASASDGAVAISSDASTEGGGGLGAGPFFIAYAGTDVGIDTRPKVTATFESGGLTKYIASDEEAPELGTLKTLEIGNDGMIAWGRWADGSRTGKFYAMEELTLGPKQGFHYAVGNATTALPTGNASYILSGATKATWGDGLLDVGTVSGSASVAFSGADTKVGLDLVLTMPGDTNYAIKTTGGTGNAASSEIAVHERFDEADAGGATLGFGLHDMNPLPAPSGGRACTIADGGGVGCATAVQGFFAGPNADRLALAVHLFSGGGGSPTSIAAVIVLAKQP